MAFGGFFGGSGSSSNNESSSSSDTSTPNITNPLSSNFPSSPSSPPGAAVQRIQNAFAEQANVANAKQLLSNVNGNCFEKCVPSPGSSLSSGEQQCLKACMEKYIDAWNVTSKTYMARLQKESAAMGGLGGDASGGKELF